jgi:hypothetical protein
MCLLLLVCCALEHFISLAALLLTLEFPESAVQLCVLAEPNQPFPSQKPLHIPLYALKLHCSTTLTLQMIEQRRQSTKLPRTSLPWTVIHLVLVDMRLTVHMLVQRYQASKPAVAKVALVAVPIPRRSCGGRGGCRGGWVREELLGDEVVWVPFADLLEDGGVVEAAGFEARAGFEVRGYACCGSEGALAERAA